MCEKSPIFDAVAKRMEQVAQRVGAIPACASISVFGLGNLFIPVSMASCIAAITFGALGALEAFHVQAHAKLNERCHLRNANALFEAFCTSYHRWHPKIVKKFNHNGFEFHSIGFNELPIPLGITNPLCPTCHESIGLELVECKYPGRIAIRFQCTCGFEVVSQKTLAELKIEAARLGGLPG